MHAVTVRKEIADRVLQRRGRYHLFDRLEAARTALIVIDMQSAFCALGAPAEVPAARGIVEPINRLTAELRALGVPVIWVLHANTVLVAGTKTNVCCESTARDAMMLDFKVVLVEDCCAALSDDEHRSALENVIQQFGDVMTADEVLSRLRRLENDRAGRRSNT